MSEAIHLDADRCYRVVQSRDERFDGWFYIGVRTTGIYCRPSCSAMTPKRQNVDFYPSAAAAQQSGFRACKRCRPDAAPGSPQWDLRSDLVARAMRLIADGVVDREGVEGIANRLGYSNRHLNRLLTDELGAGPLALARSQRAQTARVLIETTDMRMTDIAYAAGFGSARQFNDTIREVFAAPPTELRRRRGRVIGPVAPGSVSVRLPVRGPFAGGQLLNFIGNHAVPGVEHWDGEAYERALDLPHGHGVVTIRLATDHVAATFVLEDWRDLAPAVVRMRRLLDLDADPVAIDAALSNDRQLAPLVSATPGLRSAGSVDPMETLVRTIIGQQVSVSGARTVSGRLVVDVAEPLRIDHAHLTHIFPSMSRLAAAPPDAFPMPTSRSATIQRVAALAVNGDLAIDFGADRHEAVEQLVAIKGIGPWTAQHVAMRGLGDPDVFLDGDLVVRQILQRLDLDHAAADAWRPWRTYAMHHLWNTYWTKGPT